MRRIRFIASLSLMFVLLSATVLAQTSKGFVVGTVVDQNAAAVAGAAVKITNVETGVVRETVSQSDGSFRLDAVDPGTYRAEVAATGFKSAASIPTLLSRVKMREPTVAVEFSSATASNQDNR